MTHNALGVSNLGADPKDWLLKDSNDLHCKMLPEHPQGTLAQTHARVCAGLVTQSFPTLRPHGL